MFGKQTAAEVNASYIILHCMPVTSNKELDTRKGLRRKGTEKGEGEDKGWKHDDAILMLESKYKMGKVL